MLAGMTHVKDVYLWERIALSLNVHAYQDHLIQLVNQVKITLKIKI
jgi:hypothetical protein